MLSGMQVVAIQRAAADAPGRDPSRINGANASTLTFTSPPSRDARSAYFGGLCRRAFCFLEVMYGASCKMKCRTLSFLYATTPQGYGTYPILWGSTVIESAWPKAMKAEQTSCSPHLIETALWYSPQRSSISSCTNAPARSML